MRLPYWTLASKASDRNKKGHFYFALFSVYISPFGELWGEVGSAKQDSIIPGPLVNMVNVILM